MTRRSLFPGLLLPLAACRSRGPSGFSGYAFVSNEGSRSVAVVDLSKFQVVRHLNFDAAPTAVYRDPRRPVVYVLTPETGTVHEIQISSLSVTRRARVASTAFSMILDPNSAALWVLSQDKKHLVRIALATFQRDEEFALPATPVDFDIAPYHSQIAVSYGAQGTVGLLDVKSQRHQSVPFGKELGRVRFQSDGNQFLVANLGEQSISIVRTSDGQLVTTLPVAVRPENFCEKPDHGEFYVSGKGGDAVVIVNPYHTEIAATVLAGRAPGAMAACYNPFYLFVANPDAGSVSVIDIDVRKMIAVASVGSDPAYITITPDNQYALVLNRGSGDMAVLDIPTLHANRRKNANLLTVIPVGDRPVCAAVGYR